MFPTIKEVDIVAKNIHNKLNIKFASPTSVHTSGGKGEDTGFPQLKYRDNTVCMSLFTEHLYSPSKEHLSTVKPVSQTLSQSPNCNFSMTPKRIFTGKNETNSNSSPLQLSPKTTDLRDYFIVTGHTPTSVGVIEIQSSTPTKPHREIKKMPCNLKKMLFKEDGSSPPSTSSTKSSMCRSHTYLSYGSLYPKHIRPGQDKKRKCNKNLPKAKRHCQSNTLTNYFHTSPNSNVNEQTIDDVAIEVEGEVMAKTGTQASPSTSANANLGLVDECGTVNDTSVLNSKHSDRSGRSGSVLSVKDRGMRRTPLKDRKNVALMNAIQEVFKKSPTSNSPPSWSTTSPHNKTRPPWRKVGTNNISNNYSILDHMKDYYTNPTSPYHKKVACYTHTNYNISIIKNKSSLEPMEVITILSDDEEEPEQYENDTFPIRRKGLVTDLTAASPSVCDNNVPEQDCAKEILSPLSMQKGSVIDLTAASPSVCDNKVPEQDCAKQILSPSSVQKGSVIDLTAASPSICDNKVPEQDCAKQILSPSSMQKGSVIDLTPASPSICDNKVPEQDCAKQILSPSSMQKGSVIDLTAASPSVCDNNVPEQDCAKEILSPSSMQKGSVIDLTAASPSVCDNKVPEQDCAKQILSPSSMQKGSVIDLTPASPSICDNKVPEQDCAKEILSPSSMQKGSVIDLTPASPSICDNNVPEQDCAKEILSPSSMQKGSVIDLTPASPSICDNKVPEQDCAKEILSPSSMQKGSVIDLTPASPSICNNNVPEQDCAKEILSPSSMQKVLTIDLTTASFSICDNKVPEQDCAKQILSPSSMQKGSVIDLTPASPSICDNNVPEQDCTKEILSPSSMQKGSVIDLTAASPSVCDNKVPEQDCAKQILSPSSMQKGSVIDLTPASPSICDNKVPEQDCAKQILSPSSMQKGSVIDLTPASPSICDNKVPEQDCAKQILSPSSMQKGSVIDLTPASPSICDNKVPEQDCAKQILSPSSMQKGSVIDLTPASPSICDNKVPEQDCAKEILSPSSMQKGSVIDLTPASPSIWDNKVPEQDCAKEILSPSSMQKGSVIDLTPASPSVCYNKVQVAEKNTLSPRRNQGSVEDVTISVSSTEHNVQPTILKPSCFKKVGTTTVVDNLVTNNEKASDGEEASISPLLQGMLIQKGVPLVMCSKLNDHKSIEELVLGQKSVVEMGLTKRITCLPPVSISSMPSAVLKDIKIRSMAMTSLDIAMHLQTATTTPSVNTMANGSLIRSVTAGQNVPQVQDIQCKLVSHSSGQLQQLQSKISHDSSTVTSKNLSSEHTKENLSSQSCRVSSGSSSATMSTPQLMSYIKDVTDKQQEDPAKRLGLVAPLCLRRSNQCFHAKHWPVSEFFINHLRSKATYELYSLHLSSCTNICSQNRFLDVLTLQWIVQFILNHGDAQLAVEAMNTLRTLVDGWPPCTPRAHLYYINFLSDPYEYTNFNMGLFEMLLLKIEEMFVSKNDKEFLYENDTDYPSSGSDNEDDPKPTKHDNIKTCFQLCTAVATDEMKARKTYDSFPSEEQRARLTAVLDTVVHIMEQDMIVYLMNKDQDQLQCLTIPTKQPLVVKMVWRHQTIHGIGTMTTMCRRIVKLYLSSSGMLRRPLARLVSLMAEVAASSERTKNSCSYFGPKSYDYAREIVSMIPYDKDLTNNVVVELKPSWLALTIIHLRLCRLMDTDRPISLELMIACLNQLVNPLPSSNDCLDNMKPTKVHRRNAEGETRLHVVCRNKKKIDEVRLLLNDPTIDVNAKDNAGWTPLHEAVNVGNLPCVELILNYRPGPGGRIVDVKAKGPNGLSVLMEAVHGGWYDICKMLLKHAGWCLLEDKDDNGWTCKNFAKSPQIVELLQTANARYPHKTVLSQPSLSTRMLTQTMLSEISRLIPEYVRLYLNTYQMQEIVNMAKAKAPFRNDVKATSDYMYTEYFYGLKNMCTVTKLAKVGKRNCNLDPIVRVAFDVVHPAMAP